ncbi:MAG: ImmA/IrrE family metallo-endopeptidase, partial [Gammaproteobacteria bacterium]|nr:ImmA/IrrE family metallo-endopeptidase [Gammaproteobacteria bacterium]
MDTVNVPRWDREKLWELAESKYAEWNPDDEIPFPADRVIETVFNVDIVPIKGLAEVISPAKAFLSGQGRQLTVDEAHMMRDGGPFRFTVAHELGHLVLHRDILAAAKYNTSNQYLEFLASIPDDTRSSMEWQANEFAGVLVVPARHLRAALDAGVQKVREFGFTGPAQVRSLWTHIEQHAAEIL